MTLNQIAKRQMPPILAMCDDLPDKIETCRTCKHCERWHYDNVTINYCTVTHSNRTQNGMMKVKVTQAACGKYEKD